MNLKIHKFCNGCDSWEDIFCDYDTQFLEDKATGVEISIEEITEKINRKKAKTIIIKYFVFYYKQNLDN